MEQVSKQKRYRMKMKAQGLCPHCGKPCAPYAECAERREAARLRRNHAVHELADYDFRRLPREGHAPRRGPRKKAVPVALEA